ncbi:hypothetical protein L7F22_047412 [Adiantum nelumboides]|nr:hypothetical protein [Adiantum nelumboides]
MTRSSKRETKETKSGSESDSSSSAASDFESSSDEEEKKKHKKSFSKKNKDKAGDEEPATGLESAVQMEEYDNVENDCTHLDHLEKKIDVLAVTRSKSKGPLIGSNRKE